MIDFSSAAVADDAFTSEDFEPVALQGTTCHSLPHPAVAANQAILLEKLTTRDLDSVRRQKQIVTV